MAISVIGPVADLVIANENISPDGFLRAAVLVNGVFPGPLITGQQGASFSLNVSDQLTDPTMIQATSIHWHGLIQKGTQWADGVVGVSQCPIIPGHSFTYQFGSPQQTGTYWYHSHLSTQYCDGLRGPFVIYDPQDPHKSLYDVDDESTILTLADWYHLPASAAGRVPVADAVLINGLGRSTGGPASPLSVVNVTPQSRYRFRLIAMSCDPNFTFSIDGHNLTVIEADGVSVNPYTVDSIQIFAGQRYSFVLNANQPVNNYWIRALPNKGPAGFDGGINSAILRYAGAPVADPTTTQVPSKNPLLETSLRPIDNQPAAGTPQVGGADVSIALNMTFNTTTFLFNVNGQTFVPPSAPVLLQILSGKFAAQDLLPQGSVFTLPRNKVIEVNIPGGAAGSPHPWHLHGHNFDVVRSVNSTDYNFLNPPHRDVVSTGVKGDNVTIRFTTDNPGPWILHCHIDWHLDIGLAVVFSEAPDAVLHTQPPAWDQLCPTYKGPANATQS
ncbi:laccase [Pluteus cervinus]|uniref:Laccase n=1 Tax=Pluteus cervinus TaxID=181527 RepID=A0ACD3A1L0_9AGAR|nr:laccase [Pluteus cervinus]